MRTAIDARLVFYSEAGIGQYIIQLIRAMSTLDTDRDEFILLQSRKDKSTIVEKDNFKRVSLWTPSHHRMEQVALRVETSHLGLDLLHSPDFIPPFRRSYLSVITVHDLAFLLYPHFLTKEAAHYYGQIDQAVRNTDHIIAVSESTKRDAVRLVGAPESRITVIHEAANPIYRTLDKEEARRQVEKRYGLAENYILFVSTIEPRKNIPTLLDAYSRLRDTYKRDELLVIAGKRGWLSEEVYMTVEELKLGEYVRFLGRVPSEDLLYLYNASSMLVHPSFYEGFGLPILEAMTCGTPVVASNVSSIPEVAGDAALLIDPNNVEELTVAMWRVLSDHELAAQMTDKGIKRAALFSWERAARQTLKVYHKTIEDGR